MQLYLGTTNTTTCPVKAIIQRLTFCGTAPGPLFILADQKPLTRQIFATSLSSFLRNAGLKTIHYNTHSFRIGAATSAMHGSWHIGYSRENAQLVEKKCISAIC